VAFNGTNFLIVWQNQPANQSAGIFGARVTPAGALLDLSGFAISTAPRILTAPHVAANGDGQFLVVWNDHRGPDLNTFDIYGARVTDTGGVVDPTGVAIANTLEGLSGLSFGPAVAPNAGTGSWEVAYSRFAPEPQYGSTRIFSRSATLN
jgi:hypothetical protein